MSNELNPTREMLVQEAIKREPRITEARKFIFKICALFLIARVVFVIVETAFILDRGLSISVCSMNYMLLVVGALFALAIYKEGAKAFVYLAMIGGIVSILNVLGADVISNLKIGDAFYKVYVFVLIGAMLIQIASMLLIILNKDCKVYFSEMSRINKEVKNR